MPKIKERNKSHTNNKKIDKNKMKDITTNKKPAAIKIKISNIYAKGDYTAEIFIGSESSPVNLIIDTGSSTLVVKNQHYQAQFDKKLTPTSLAQEVNYGIGGFNGPVIKTNITIGHDNQSLSLTNATLALVTDKKQQQTFADADGILGLAYHHLNKGFVMDKPTYPWPYTDKSADLKAFKKFLWQHQEQDILPYFTELEQHNLCANKFAFYSKRSSIHHQQAPLTIEDKKQDPQNQGYLILGGGEEQTDLYKGKFESIKVTHDVYYNVELVSVQVANNPPIIAPPLDDDHKKAYLTNAIIDTGAGGIVLTNALYQQIIKELIATNASFEALLAPFTDIEAQEVGIDANLLTLTQWPTITFTFIGEHNNKINLCCQPHTYWQINTPSYGKACFRLLSQLPQWPNQSIIGLPLLNNYYVVFDRTEDKTGVIKFAKQQ